jgi:hypothetical protein
MHRKGVVIHSFARVIHRFWSYPQLYPQLHKTVAYILYAVSGFQGEAKQRTDLVLCHCPTLGWHLAYKHKHACMKGNFRVSRLIVIAPRVTKLACRIDSDRFVLAIHIQCPNHVSHSFFALALYPSTRIRYGSIAPATRVETTTCSAPRQCTTCRTHRRQC